jgi:hypothetical protein
MSKPPKKPRADKSERETHLQSLRQHGRVIEADSEDVDLPAGVTHVQVTGKDGARPRLIEKRKSFF